MPAVNQIEVHPYFAQPEVQAFGAGHGILTQAWSPIGGITFYRDGQHTSTLQDPVIGDIAKAHGKSPAQTMLRWGIQQGRSVIPKSTKPARITENIDVFDFELTPGQIAAIDALDTGHRGGPEPDAHHAQGVRARDPGGVTQVTAGPTSVHAMEADVVRCPSTANGCRQERLAGVTPRAAPIASNTSSGAWLPSTRTRMSRRS